MIVAPSILAADFGDLKQQLKLIENADWLHFDVMDGHFVPNISFGPIILEKVKPLTKLFIDVHLMIDDPLFYSDAFIKAGADLIVFHYEVANDLAKAKAMIHQIKAKKVQVGLSIKPATPVETILPLLPLLDVLLIMSVEPGFGGQVFMDDALTKIKIARAYIDQHALSCLSEVDGGINQETAYLCKKAGVDVIVAGSYLFNHPQIEEAIFALR